MSKNLILYGHSGFSKDQTGKLDEIVPNLEDATVVLMEDAIFGTSKASTTSPYENLIQNGVKILALSEDLEARGIGADSIVDGINTIDYLALIDEIEASERITSWL